VEEICIWHQGPLLCLLHNKSTYSADSVIKYCNLSINTNADNAMSNMPHRYFGHFKLLWRRRNNMGQLPAVAYIANLMWAVTPPPLTV